jgi:electron-transferring-flavoprotein dehydrogenase
VRRRLLLLFFRSFTIKSPICPPNFQKKGYHVASLSNVTKWLAEKCEAAGHRDLPRLRGRPAAVEGGRVVGVRIGDMGVDRHGKPKPTYQPGMDIRAKVTVLGEGVRGSLTKQLIERFELQGQNPQVYETGIKEIWRVKPEKHKPGRVSTARCSRTS